MSKYQEVLDMLGTICASGLTTGVKQDVLPGIVGIFTEDEINRFELPIRIASCQLDGAVDDMLILVGGAPDDLMAEGMKAMVSEMLTMFSIEATASEPDVMEVSDRDEALEAMTALWNERTVSFNSSIGDFLLFVSDKLLATASGETYDPADFSDAPAAETAGGGASTGGDSATSAPAAAPAPAASTAAVEEEDEDEYVVPTYRPRLYDDTLNDLPDAGPPGGRKDQWSELLTGVDVTIHAELGNTMMTLGDATALMPESILTLDQETEEPMIVYVNGAPYATARLVVVDDYYGIEIIEVTATDLEATAETWLAA